MKRIEIDAALTELADEIKAKGSAEHKDAALKAIDAIISGAASTYPGKIHWDLDEDDAAKIIFDLRMDPVKSTSVFTITLLTLQLTQMKNQLSPPVCIKPHLTPSI